MSHTANGELSPEQLRWRCDPSIFPTDSTADLPKDAPVIGQDRALKALKLGVEVRSPGYNVFVAGLSGTGRMTAVRRMLIGLSDSCVTVPDKAYVHSFEDPSHPRLVQLPRGQIKPFAARMEEFVQQLRRNLRTLFESEQYREGRSRIELATQDSQGEVFAALADEARLKGLALVQIQQGPMMRPGLGIPLEEDEVVPFEAIKTLVRQGRIDEERAELLQTNADELRRKLDKAVVEARKTLRNLQKELDQYDRHQARAVFGDDLRDLKEHYPDPVVQEYLERLEEAVLDRLALFRQAEDEDQEPALRGFLRRLQVNVILDNSEREDTPVLVEAHPTLSNLCGTVEHRTLRTGDLVTDHTRIRPGSLVEADGGYLILSAEDVLQEPGVWPALKRVLKTNQLEIQPRATLFGPSPLVFKPDPIPLQVKVILIGDSQLYGLLYSYDPDFRKSFKIRADFDSVMPRTEENAQRYALFLARLCEEETLLPFDRTALAAVAEAGARRADHGRRLSTRFSGIADLARESHHVAVTRGAHQVTGEDVHAALQAARERDDLYDEKLQDAILEGSVLIDTRGRAVGQVNGLAVYSSGTWAFGKPSRITATVAAGDHGILNIEREVQLSGEIHDKGVLILTSFLRERFGQQHPLALTASLCFEQNYSGVDGDSASSTELYALLSALSGLALDQGIAVTGSVNQKGEIQPIGGINEKVEGFYRICAARGLEERCGVLMPVQNVDDLMLDPEVVQAVADGNFHLWAISHVDQGIELLTGVPAGERDAEGSYPEDSVNGRVAARLLDLAEIARDFKAGSGDEKDEDGHEDHGRHEDGPGDDLPRGEDARAPEER